jgi:hypothetical protein
MNPSSRGCRPAVEPLFQLVVGQTVTQAANDKQQMVPLIAAIEEKTCYG